jgi:hypothetical protein
MAANASVLQRGRRVRAFPAAAPKKARDFWKETARRAKPADIIARKSL